MCACGRSSQQVTTSIQAEQERQAALTQTAKENLALEMENIRRSSGNALTNAGTR